MIYASSKRNFTDTQKETMWQLWSHGQSLSEIGRSIGKHAGSVFCFLQKNGGIKPSALSRAKSALTILDREEISRGISAHLSIRRIARNLNRAPSTISREIHRNGGLAHYRAIQADKNAWEREKRLKDCLLSLNTKLKKLVSTKLA